MSETNHLDAFKAQVKPEVLKVEVIDTTKPITVKVRDENDNITERTYTYKPWVPRWSQLCDWAAEISSGMIIKSKKDENGDEVSIIEMTKDYSSKKNKVMTEIVRSTFSLDVSVDKIEPDSMFDLLSVIEDGGFLVRLERLNLSSSTSKKSTTK
jgi:hypothetical protein